MLNNLEQKILDEAIYEVTSRIANNYDLEQGTLEDILKKAYEDFIQHYSQVQSMDFESQVLLFLLLAHSNDIESLKIFFQNTENNIDIIEHYIQEVLPLTTYDETISEDKQLETIKYILALVPDDKKFNLVEADQSDLPIHQGICYIISFLQLGRIKIIQYLMTLYPTEINWSTTILDEQWIGSTFTALLEEYNSLYGKIVISPQKKAEVLEFLLIQVQDKLTKEFLAERPDIVKAQEYINEYKQAIKNYKSNVLNFLITNTEAMITNALPAEIWHTILLNLETTMLIDEQKGDIIQSVQDRINKIVQKRDVLISKEYMENINNNKPKHREVEVKNIVNYSDSKEIENAKKRKAEEISMNVSK